MEVDSTTFFPAFKSTASNQHLTTALLMYYFCFNSSRQCLLSLFAMPKTHIRFKLMMHLTSSISFWETQKCASYERII